MSRDELSPEARAELDALERILAREPIGEEHLELAALVDSVRAQAPRIGTAFAARLDARLAQRVGRRRRVRRAGRSALAAGGIAAVAAAVALTIVITTGTLDRAAGSHDSGAARSPSTASARAVAGGATQRFSVAHAPSASSGDGARLVRRSATLELATRAPTLLRVADRVVVVTERDGGFVESSVTSMAGAGGRARFSLRVPSARFELVITGLVSLAHLRGLSEVTSDITGGYDSARAALARRRSELAVLMRRLARTSARALALTLRRRVGTLDALIGADARRASALDGEARTAALHVAVVATPSG